MKNTSIESIAEASGNATNATVPRGNDGNIDWPIYSAKALVQMKLNTMGGTVSTVFVTPDLDYFERFDWPMTSAW